MDKYINTLLREGCIQTLFVTWKWLKLRGLKNPQTIHKKSGNYLEIIYSRSCPNTIRLNPKIIFMHGNPEEPVLPPVGSPGVPPDPVLLTSTWISPPSNHGDLVVDDGMLDLLRVYPPGVAVKSVRRVDSATWKRRLKHNFMYPSIIAKTKTFVKTVFF